MKSYITVLIVILLGAYLNLNSQWTEKGDTLIVKTLTYDSIETRSGNWNFPPKDNYEKIIMHYSLKCDPRTKRDNFDCGEWDYLTYTVANKNDINYEIHRFITPYGIGLDLGPDGFTWVEDVSDFAPILHDSVNFRAGNQQELIDVTFYFIKGTPPRDVLNVTPIWQSGGSYQSIVDNENIAPKQITTDSEASMFKAITRASGHGFGEENDDNCAEFCNRDHSLWIDGEKIYEWEGWKECGDNPVFPQGGTWVIDRSDWCPGATVNTHQHELTGIIEAGQEYEFDYEIENPPELTPAGNYRFSSYLFEYGEPNFTNDVSIERIISPSLEDEFNRLNPICKNPVIVIKNTGSETLTSLDIEYGIKGGDADTYKWEGNLEFLSEQEVSLPPLEMSELEQGNRYEFEVTLKNPNGKTDEYERNNYGVTEFESVDALYKKVTINLNTYNYTSQHHRIILQDAMGNEILRKEVGELDNSKDYTFEYELENGCYELLFENVEGYGLGVFFIDQLGNGRINFEAGSYYKTFKSDFGNFIKYQFIVETKPELLVINDPETINFGRVEPGEQEEQTIGITPANEKGLLIKNIEIPLAPIKNMELIEPKEIPQGGINLKEGEILDVTVRYSPKNKYEKTGVLNIATNAEPNSVHKIPLIGNEGVTNISTTAKSNFTYNIVHTNNDFAELNLKLEDYLSKELEIDLYSITGNKLKDVFTGIVENNKYSIPIDTKSLNNGVYLLRVRVGYIVQDLKLMIAK